jgi:hypothetical protein
LSGDFPEVTFSYWSFVPCDVVKRFFLQISKLTFLTFYTFSCCMVTNEC